MRKVKGDYRINQEQNFVFLINFEIQLLNYGFRFKRKNRIGMW